MGRIRSEEIKTGSWKYTDWLGAFFLLAAVLMLGEYVGTDEYVEDVAREKLGLIHENEIILKAE